MTDERKHRSVSQINQYNRCAYAYKLSRIDKVWQRPAAWLAQGSAVHEAAEAWEKSGRTMTLEEAQKVYTESYAKHIDAACEVTPNFEYWFRSGPYAGETDTLRRYGIGLEQVEKYIRWYESHPEEVIWIAEDGTPGIEIGFDIDLDGVLVRGFIDAVIAVETDELCRCHHNYRTHAEGMCSHCSCGDWVPVPTAASLLVRDNKTGNSPGDDFQLGVYGVALAEQFGIEPPQIGDYWMGRSGKPTLPYKIGEWTREKVSEKFRELEENIAAERFDPKPEPSKCRFCDVASSCEYSSA